MATAKRRRRYDTRTSYASLYNAAYMAHKQKKDINPILHRRLTQATRFSTLRKTSWIILTISQTQTIGHWIRPELVDRASRVQQTCMLGRTVLLRRLQRRIVTHLWRPHGTLFYRHLPCDMPMFVITPTQGEEKGGCASPLLS